MGRQSRLLTRLRSAGFEVETPPDVSRESLHVRSFDQEPGDSAGQQCAGQLASFVGQQCAGQLASFVPAPKKSKKCTALSLAIVATGVLVIIICLAVFPSDSPKCDVIVVGPGLPNLGMGWYHATQLLRNEVPSARLTDVVEPFFVGAGADLPAGEKFNVWATEVSKQGVKFFPSINKLPPLANKTLALISGRTADNPRLLKEVIAAGATHVYLETPGAPTVTELDQMKKFAQERGVPVYMGYNKNVAKYVSDALEYQKKTPGSSMTFIHNNAYNESELPECFERNSEGMLKNMAIHELALLATYYGVTKDNINTVQPHKEYTSCLTLKGPASEKFFTDFSKVGFTVTTKDGKSVTVKADRCGSHEYGDSVAVVSVGGEEKYRTETPDAALKKTVEKERTKNPEIMPYFVLQSDDYITLKERCTAHILSGKVGGPEGVATIDIALEALRTAEYITPILKKASCSDKAAKESSDPQSEWKGKGTRVIIIGNGNVATSVAKVIGKDLPSNFNKYIMMYFNPAASGNTEMAAVFNKEHINHQFLPHVELPHNVVAVTDTTVVLQADIVVWCLPRNFLQPTVAAFAKAGGLKPGAIAISLMEGGFDLSTGDIPIALGSEAIRAGLHLPPGSVSVMRGASIANEVGAGKFAEATIGCRRNCEILHKLFKRPLYQVTVVPDAEAVEMLGGLKNIVALGAGFAAGSELGDVGVAAVTAAGISDMFSVITGFFPETTYKLFLESAGLADLVATCYGGRDRICSERFGQLMGGRPSREKPEQWIAIEKEMLNEQFLHGTLTSKELQPILEKLDMASKAPLLTKIWGIAFGSDEPESIKEVPLVARIIQLVPLMKTNPFSTTVVDAASLLAAATKAVDVSCDRIPPWKGGCNNINGAIVRQGLVELSKLMGADISVMMNDSVEEIAYLILACTGGVECDDQCLRQAAHRMQPCKKGLELMCAATTNMPALPTGEKIIHALVAEG